ncbi:DUF2971 domain-containing protein [Sphingomonas koreensis]
MKIIRSRRIRLSRLKSMNDPFELLAVEASDKLTRAFLRSNRDQVHETTGFICFSKSWRNPVQWGHYAERHKGLCLGFDVNDDHLSPVHYAPARVPALEFRAIVEAEDLDGLRRIGTTKYDHWHYEDEVRSLHMLSDPEPDGVAFGPDLALREVMVGANNTILTRKELTGAVNGLGQVRLTKVRPSFKEFKMVEQKDPKLGLR